MNQFDMPFEGQDANPLDKQELNITDNSILDQVVSQPDLTVSDPLGEEPNPISRMISGVTPTNKLSPVKGSGDIPPTNPKKKSILRVSQEMGIDNSNTGNIEAGSNDYDSYSKYLPGGEAGIATPTDLWNKERALRQSNWDQAGNAGLRILGNIVPEILQQGSRMLDFSGDYSSDNAVGEAMQKWKDSVNEGTPIYRENPTEAMNFGDFAYWMEQGSNLVTSAGAFAALGYATAGVGGIAMRGAGTAVKAVSGTRTGAGIAQFLETGGNTLLNAYALNKAEGVGVAIDTYKQSYEKELEAQATTNKSEEEKELTARKKAAEAASFAYNMNKINIALNITSAMKFVKPYARGTRQNISTDNLFNNATNTAVRTGKQEAIHIAKELGLEGSQEYIEETINYISQKRGVEGGADQSLKDIFNNSLKDATDKEAVEAGIWGFLGGIGQTAFTKVGAYIPMHKNQAYTEAYQNEIGKLQQAVNKGESTLTDEEIIKKAQEVATQKAGNANKRVSNNYIREYRDASVIEARQRILDNFSTNEDAPSIGKSKILETSTIFNTIQQTLDLYDQEQEAERVGDTARANQIRETLFTNQVLDSIKSGTLNTLEDSLKALRSLSPKEAVEQGLAEDEQDHSYKEKINKALQTINIMETNAIRNEKYLNNDAINAIDTELLVQNELAITHDQRFRDYRQEQFKSQNEKHLTTPYLKTSYEDYTKLTQVERAEQYTPEQISEISTKAKEREAIFNRDFNNPTIKELNSDPVLAKLWKNKKDVDQIIDTLNADREFLTSEDTQKMIRNIQIDSEEQSALYRAELQEVQRKAKEEAKQSARLAKQQAKQQKNATNQQPSAPLQEVTQNPTVETISSSQPITTPPIIQASAEVIEDEEGNAEIITSNYTPVSETNTALSDNKSFINLETTFGQDNEAVVKYKTFITTWLNKIKTRDTSITQEWFNKAINILDQSIMKSRDSEKAFLTQNPSLQTFEDQGTSISGLFNAFFREEIERFTGIKNTYSLIGETISSINQQQSQEVAEATTDEILNTFEEDIDSESEDLDALVEQQNKEIDFKSPLRMAETVLNLVNNLNERGIKINNFDDLYIQFVNASSKTLVDNILPKLENIWNYAVRDNQINGIEIGENDFKVDPISIDVQDIISNQIVENVWGEDKAVSLDRQFSNLVNDINKSMIGNQSVLRQSGTGTKSTTALNIAWNAREYIGRINSQGAFFTERLEDAQEGVNTNSSYELFDDTTLPINTELTLLPLGLGKDYTYYEFGTGRKITYRRTSPEVVERITFDGNVVSSPEILDAIDYLPIFISKSSKESDIIEGAFIHNIEWANSNNLAGDEQEVEEAKIKLKELRTQVVNNLNKQGNNKRLIKVKITNKSLGVPIRTKGTSDKVNNRIANDLELAIVAKNFIKSKPNNLANFHNKLHASDMKDGTTLILLPTNKEFVAYPIYKEKLGTLEGNNITNSIVSVLDLFFTNVESMTSEQKKQYKDLKSNGIDVKSFDSVKGYLGQFLFTNVLAKKGGEDKKSFVDFMKTDQKNLNDTSVFRFTKDGNNKPYIQFGRIGSSASEINFDNYQNNKVDLQDTLTNVLNNAYVNTNLFILNTKRKVIGIVNGEVQILYNTYNDMIKDVSSTDLQPETVINPKTKKEKTIYTFQKTFELSEPINVKKNAREEQNNSIQPKQRTVESIEDIPADIEKEVLPEEVQILLDQNDDEYYGTFEETTTFPDKRSVDFESIGKNYTYIKGINSIIQNSVINNIKNNITQQVITTNKPVNIRQAINDVINEIKATKLATETSFNLSKSNLTDDQQTILEKRLNLTQEKIDILVNNIPKLERRVRLSIKQEGIGNELRGKEKQIFNEERQRLAEEYAKAKEQKDLGLIEAPTEENLLPLSGEQQILPEIIDEFTDEENENSFDTDSIGINPVTSMSKAVKSFFDGIEEVVYKDDKFITVKNYLGLKNYVPFNTVYQKVQELLALYPSKSKITPSFDNYVSILEQHQKQIPYLKNVVDKLKGEVTEQFRVQFVNSLYKMYHNTVFLQTSFKQKLEGQGNYSSYLINTDSNNYVSLIKAEWLNNFNNSNNYTIDNTDPDNPKKIIIPAIKNAIGDQYRALTTNRIKIDSNILDSYFSMMGIKLPLAMINNLVQGTFIYNGKKYSASSFMKIPTLGYAISSITGRASEGSEGITDLLSQDMYKESGFTMLANMIALYKDNYSSNSSRNINGDMNFNFGEVKNLIDTFNKVKYDLDFMTKSLTDPYRMLDNIEVRSNKKYPTFLDEMFIGDKTNLKYNEASNFLQSFKYFTYTGGKIKDINGTVIQEVDKYSDLGYTKAKLNLFLNQGNTIGSGSNMRHVANYMYFTMSDKKVPMGFSAPSVRFTIEAIANPLQDQKDFKEGEHQLNYLFDTMVKPDIQRFIYLSKKEIADEINIKGYEAKNSRFFTIPMLNLIDFDYIDGDINNEKDSGLLREQLGLSIDENLFTISGEGKSLKKEINVTVLQRPEVQAFLKEKMRQHLKDKFIEFRQELANNKIIERVDNKWQWSKTIEIDKEVAEKLYGKGERGINTFLLNYSLNTSSALAQFQQLLIGDPIQFFKDSKTSNNIRKQLGKNVRKLAILNHRIKLGKISDEEGIALLQELTRERLDLRRDFIRSHGLSDILTTNDNQGKRLAGDNASGSKMVYPSDNSSYNLLVLEDVEVASKLRDFYYETLVPDYIKDLPENTISEQRSKKKAIDNILEKYDNINQADAQELTTLEEHLNTMVFLGELDQESAKQMIEADNKGKLSVKDYNSVLQPMKLVYSNNYMRDGINSRLYVKSSSFPLAKTFTSGMPIDRLRQYMEDNNIQRTAFKSAVKVGQPKGIAGLQNIFNKDNTVNIKDATALNSTVIRDIPRDGHKKQQNVPYDENKHEINDGTQKAKMLFLNLMDVKGFESPIGKGKQTGRELYDGYKEVYRQYYKIQYNNLINDLYPEYLKGELDYSKLHSIIIEEAESRGMSENDLAYFSLNKDKTGFEFPLWLSGNDGKLTSLLNAIVDNRIRKRKREGKSAVLLSDIVLSTDPKYKSNITYTSLERPTELRSMRDENGKIELAEVIMPFYFRDNKGKKLKLKDFIKFDGTIDEEKLPSDILETIGFRIPTQGLNSMDAIKVVGFLPEGYENTVIAPRDFITQMGSDFDVDKLFQDMVNTVYEEGRLKKIGNVEYKEYAIYKDYKRKLKVIKNLKRQINEVEEGKANTLMARIGGITAELGNMRGTMTQEEYLDKYRNFPKDIELKYLENLMLDFNKAILTNPSKEVQMQRTAPIDSATFREITEDILETVYTEQVNDNWTPYNDLFQTKKYISARGGKSGVSTYSSTSVLNTVLQTVNYKVTPINFQRYDKDLETYIPVYYNLFGNKSNDLNNPLSADGNYKSDIIQALQSITVDNENLQAMHKINLNDFTADFVRGAALSGSTAKDIFYIINHPVVKEYVRAKQTGDVIKAPKYFKDIEVNGEKVRKIYTSKEIKDSLKTLTHEEMIKDIQDNFLDVDSLTHYAIYNIFEDISSKGKTLKSIEGLLNVDSKGLGTNLFYSLEKEQAILNLVTNKEISNASLLLGEFQPEFDNSLQAINIEKYDEEGRLTKAYKDAYQEYSTNARNANFVLLNDMWFKPNNIPSMAAVYALVTNNKLWSKEFPYNNPTINTVTRVGIQMENNKKTDKYSYVTGINPQGVEGFKNKEVKSDTIATTSPQRDSELKQLILNEYKSYLYTSISSNPNIDRKALFINNNLADIINHIKTNNLLPYNTFIKRLNIINENKEELNPLNNIIYNASSRETVEENGIVSDILSMLQDTTSFEYNGRSYTFNEIAQDLIKHQMLTGGIQRANQFVKHIPPHYLKLIGLYNTITDIINNYSGIKNDKFQEQYIQHNPYLVASSQLRDMYLKNEIKIKDGIIEFDTIALSQDMLEENARNYISIPNTNGFYSLFKRNPYNINQFIQIPTLGKNGIKEYNADATNVIDSIFVSNNPETNWYQREETLQQITKSGIPLELIADTIKTRLAIGLENPESNNAIVKICK